MNKTVITAAAACLLAGAAVAAAQTPETPGTESSAASRAFTEPTVPIERVIAAVAKKTGKLFVVDPRVRADVLLIGGSASELTYAEFLGLLAVYGFVAVDDGHYVRVVPDANTRYLAVPTIGPKDTRLAAEIVSEVIQVKNVSAAQLVPILRPMIPQYGAFVAYLPTNSLVIVDHFDNVRRLEGIIHELDAAGANRRSTNDGPNPSNPDSGSK
jgi:general secretion pathway protein D